MTKLFLDEDFLLNTATAKKLYQDYAKDMPIFDYHCHLPVREIAEDRRFENLTQIWLKGDHYKWRAMRANGIDERYITGDATDEEKFNAWALTVPKTLRNPLYHWTHLELKRYFDIEGVLLNENTAREIYHRCNDRLKTPLFSARSLLKRMNVNIICTTDDPADNLEFHRQIAGESNPGIKVFPAFRADKVLAVDQSPEDYNRRINRLEEISGVSIDSYDSLLSALLARHDHFHKAGCRLSDNGLNQLYAADYSEKEVANIFKKIRQGQWLEASERIKFKSSVLFELSCMNAEKGWTQQFHLGSLRNTNSRAMKHLGPDTGYDGIGDFEMAKPLAAFLDRLDIRGKLAKTIIYNLNPSDNELIATIIGNYQDGSVAGKMQFGTAWWFLDQKDGIEKQLNSLSNMGLLSLFVGMTTDSRSFLSFPRHEYFRRILCNLLGTDFENGELPNDIDLIGGLVKDVCYRNAEKYFGLTTDNSE